MRDPGNIVFKDEDSIIEKCIDWDRNAQNALYKLYAGKMLTVCLRYSKNREEAEDTLHEGFLKVFENIQKFKKQGSLEGWIRKIMFHCAIEKYRKRKSDEDMEVSIDGEVVSQLIHSDENIESKINSKELIALIQQLSPRYRMVFNLYVFEGLTHKEIAAMLKVSEGTSKSNLHDARAILQRAVNSINNPVIQK